MSHFRPLLRYHGGKAQLAPWIVSHFPAHAVYCEPFGGGGSVLLAKQRAPFREVYGDLDEEIVSLFRVVRDPMLSLALEAQLRLTPYARSEFEASYEPSVDPVEQARRTVTRAHLGFGSGAASGAQTGFRQRAQRPNSDVARIWARVPDRLAAFTARLQGVVIERLDALELLRREDRPDCLHYLDPPYVLATRKMRNPYCKKGYRYELSDADHEALAEALHGLAGMVVLSGYPSDLYDRLYGDWRREEKTAHDGVSSPRTECLWINPACAAALDAERRWQDAQCGLFADVEIGP